ncbi:loricrin-like isoform X2 [Stylophora pistillata]|uniref:loricrin-like isoform X2 n=1 Tax=Stylophora pistillata TaxID=50429 RepID=UPI000C039F2C|nr:loricrin-like isoform X2 [Stylophora pistillata]
MGVQVLFHSPVFLYLLVLFHSVITQYNSDTREVSIFGMMLQEHIFKTITGAAFGDVCLLECYGDVRCQSFNYVFTQDKCELSNRAKEARPEDFVPNSERYYFRRDIKRAHLGAIPELPADSCKEIKSSEGGQAVSGKYWLNFIKPDTPVLAHCDMKTEDTDECNASIGVCDVSADCRNTLGSYRCSCRTGFSGDGHTCKGFSNFKTDGRRGRFGIIQKFTAPRTSRYLIKAWGARGGTHSYDYGYNPGTYFGGKGAFREGKFRLNNGTVLNIVIGQRGGDSVEVKGGNSTNKTAAQLGVSVEDNAGTGGGGGSFVYTTADVLLLVAGGGGGASSGYNGVDGQVGSSGTSSVGKESSQVRNGGTGGQPGECNTAGGNYHGGVGAGWLGQGCTRLGSSHGERGGSRAQGWIGGQAGGMNSGNNGGPAPGAVGGFGGGGGGSEDNGASGGGGGYSGGGSGISSKQAGGGGGSYCSGEDCSGLIGGNSNEDGLVQIFEWLG